MKKRTEEQRIETDQLLELHSKRAESKSQEAGRCAICQRMHTRRRGPGRNDRLAAYCHDCHAGYMRKNRPVHQELPRLARQRANARAYANSYLRRGKLRRGPCEKCGKEPAEMHHDDYSKPLAVRWLCRKCHLDHHRLQDYGRLPPERLINKEKA